MNTFIPCSLLELSLSIKNTLSPLADSWNWPGSTRETSLRFWYWSRKSSIWLKAQGKTSKARTRISTKIGQAKRKSGRTSEVRPRPLHSQITISLSRYIRVSTLTMAKNRLKDKIAGIWDSTE